MKREGARLPVAAGVESDSEESHLVGDLQAFSGRRALSQHRSGEVGNTHLPCRIRCPSAPDQQDEVSEGELMVRYDEQLESVRQLSGDDRRQRNLGRSSKHRWLSTIESLSAKRRVYGRQEDGAHGDSGERSHLAPPAALSISSFFPSGTTVNTILGFPRYVLATR